MTTTDKPTATHPLAMPYFEGDNVARYMGTRPAGQVCYKLDCKATEGLLACKTGVCGWGFCKDHRDHLHRGCAWTGCQEYGVTYSYVAKAESCYDHAKKWIAANNSWSSSSSAKCRDCKADLPCYRENIGYCVTCNGKWQSLKNKGVKGPFG